MNVRLANLNDVGRLAELHATRIGDGCFGESPSATGEGADGADGAAAADANAGADAAAGA